MKMPAVGVREGRLRGVGKGFTDGRRVAGALAPRLGRKSEALVAHRRPSPGLGLAFAQGHVPVF